jgi:hypothetical protein
MTQPKFFIEPISPWQREFEHGADWILAHDALVAAIKSLGCDFELLEFRDKRRDKNAIYILKHSVEFRPNVWNLKKSYIPNYFYFDRRGYSGWSQMATDPGEFRRAMSVDQGDADSFFANEVRAILERRVTKLAQEKAAFETPNVPFVLMPLQLSYDSVMRLSYFSFFDAYCAVRDWCRLNQIVLVVKPHPLASLNPHNDRRDEETFRVLDDAHTRDDVIVATSNIIDLIEQSKMVFVVNSGTGFEALLRHKNVCTLGDNDYKWATQHVTGIDGFSDISMDQYSVLNKDQLNRFLYYFMGVYLMDVNDAAAVEQKVQHAVAAWAGSRAWNA